MRLWPMIAIVLGCTPAQTLPAALTPTAQQETVVGRYEELNVAQRGTHYVGRAVIRTDDGESVLLETHDAGIRPPQEIAIFRGKRVVATGRSLRERCHAWGDGTEATIVGRCLKQIESIVLAE